MPPVRRAIRLVLRSCDGPSFLSLIMPLALPGELAGVNAVNRLIEGSRCRSAEGRARVCRNSDDDEPLGVLDALVCEERGVSVEGPEIDEAHGLLAAGLAEEALAGAEHDREDLQP